MRNLEFISLDKKTVEVQPSGFLNVLANLSRTGVFTYSVVDAQGRVSIMRQLRHPDEVFAQDSLDTLIGLPATNGHPQEKKVNLDNASGLIVGMTSDKPSRVAAQDVRDKDEYIRQLVTFFHKETIAQIMDGSKREMSLGYSCELEDSPGEWNGVKYDFIQRNIRYNHFSLERRGRAGAECRVLVDGREEVVQCDGLIVNDEEESEDMLVFNFDGKEYKVEKDLHGVLTQLNLKLAELKGVVDTQRADIDRKSAQCDDLKSQLEAKKLNNDDKAAFQSAVKKRVELERRAVVVLGDSEDVSLLSDREVKAKVIEKIRPGTNLDSRSDDYVDGRFEMCVEDYQGGERPSGEKKVGNSVVTDNADDDDIVATSRAKAWEKARNQYKSKAE